MSKDTKILREASSLFMEMACIYEQMADLEESEDTKENQDKLTMLIGKMMLTVSKVQALDV
ncbi:hypothetical protein [Romboutsia lituseburensis]|uniref:hypothetical protein n=1 Tax=Romboutsia lituseburensis TaxID=1537 RepID=UPI0011132103|nr:hypothetical protein [Romboutsia lituseburensis]